MVGRIETGEGYDWQAHQENGLVRIICRKTGRAWVATFADLLPLAIAAGIDDDRATGAPSPVEPPTA
jgi:hypothetical protein